MPPKRPVSVILGPGVKNTGSRKSPFGSPAERAPRPHRTSHGSASSKPATRVVKVTKTVERPKKNVKIVRVTKRPASHDDLTKAKKRVMKARVKSLEKHKQRTQHAGPKPKKKIPWGKIAFWAVLIAILFAIWNYLNIPELLISLLQQNPTVWAIYQHAAGEVEARSLLGLAYASFFGSLFFISLPVEVIFLYYLGLNYYFVQIITIVLLGNILGMLFNYGCGWLIGERVVQWAMKENYKKFMKKLNKAGAFIILIGNIIPFPIEPFAVFLGAVRYNFKRFLIFTIVGKLAKFILLYLGYFYFTIYAAPYLQGVSVDWFIQTIKDVFVFW